MNEALKYTPMTVRRRPQVSGLFGIACLMAAAVALSGCAETRLAAHTAKEISGSTTPRKAGAYKVGKPYQIAGTWYYPGENYDYVEEGVSSWYGPSFDGKLTANGEVYDMLDLTAAHRTLPLPSIVRVTNLANGRSVVLRINDRGPFAKSRIIDVSKRAADILGFIPQGTARVRVELLADESRALKAEILTAQGDMPAVAAAPRQTVSAQSLDASPAPAPTVIAPSAVSIISQAQAAPVQTASAAIGPGVWVQAGAFSDLGNAQRLASRLGGSVGGTTSISPVTVAGQELYRVRLGPIADPSEVERVLAAVRATGLPGARVVTE